MRPPRRWQYWATLTWPPPPTRCPASCPQARWLLEGLDAALVEMIRNSHSAARPSHLPAGNGWLMVEVGGRIRRGGRRSGAGAGPDAGALDASCCRPGPRPSGCGRSAPTVPVWPAAPQPEPRHGPAGRIRQSRPKSGRLSARPGRRSWTAEIFPDWPTATSVTAASTCASISP